MTSIPTGLVAPIEQEKLSRLRLVGKRPLERGQVVGSIEEGLRLGEDGGRQEQRTVVKTCFVKSCFDKTDRIGNLCRRGW